MRKLEREELLQLIESELQRFSELNEQKQALWQANTEFIDGMTIQDYERIKLQWQDSADEITSLHRQLYPHFPRTGTCYNCGGDLLPVHGTNPISMDSCVVCGREVMR